MIKSRSGLTVLLIIGVLILAMVYLPGLAQPDVAELPVPLTDLHQLEELQARFNQDDNIPRLILVLSPT